MADKRPRFLFITVDVPRNGGSGGQIVSWRLLESYARFGDVDLIAIVPPGTEIDAPLAELTDRLVLVPLASFYYARARLRLAARFLLSQFGRDPYRLAKFRSGEVTALVRKWCSEREYALVHCDHLSSAQYRPLLADTPAVLMEHNVEWRILSRHAEARKNPAARALLRRDASRTREWEAGALRRFDHAFALSGNDRQELLALCPELESRISVWPMPVASFSTREQRARGRPFTILVLGSLRSVGRVEGLRWFLREVWPRVRRQIPSARLEVVGADPPNDISTRNGSDGIRVRGYVESLDDVLEQVDLCAIPLFVGGGIRVKVLELIARGIPCFGTEIALEGLTSLQGVRQLDAVHEWVEALASAAAQPDALLGEAHSGAADLARDHSRQGAEERLARVLDAVGASARSVEKVAASVR